MDETGCPKSCRGGTQMWWIIIALVALFCYVFFLITKAAVKAAIRELEAEKTAATQSKDE